MTYLCNSFSFFVDCWLWRGDCVVVSFARGIAHSSYRGWNRYLEFWIIQWLFVLCRFGDWKKPLVHCFLCCRGQGLANRSQKIDWLPGCISYVDDWIPCCLAIRQATGYDIWSKSHPLYSFDSPVIAGLSCLTALSYFSHRLYLPSQAKHFLLGWLLLLCDRW